MPGYPLEPGKIYDSNRSMLLASLHERGFLATGFGIATDDRESLVEQIRSILECCDVLITSGGVSMGEKVIAIIFFLWGYPNSDVCIIRSSITAIIIILLLLVL